MTSVARYFLGDSFFLKFNSCFVKPARTGSATPWHQDNGLWRDGETEPFNFWMALDPATTQNGCLQFIPGSHKLGIFPHILYDDSIHPELPREEVRQLIADRGVEHCELDSGDVVCWHSSICHYSPPNPSPRGRIAIAGVYSTPQITRRRNYPGHSIGCFAMASCPPPSHRSRYIFPKSQNRNPSPRRKRRLPPLADLCGRRAGPASPIFTRK